jgi:methionyl-tRNA formyltransferase
MGDLPRYRGNACPNWAILDGESKVVLTIHRMNQELDAGAILVQDSLPLSDGTYIGEIYDWFHAVTPELFLKAIHNVVSGIEVAQSSQIRPLRTFPRIPEDSRLEWDESRTRLLRVIRASSRPFKGAYCFFGDDRKRVTVWRADNYQPEYDFRAIPGQVCFRVENDLVVACGDGMIRLLEIESPFGDHVLSSDKIGASLRNRLF